MIMSCYRKEKTQFNGPFYIYIYISEAFRSRTFSEFLFVDFIIEVGRTSKYTVELISAKSL